MVFLYYLVLYILYNIKEKIKKEKDIIILKRKTKGGIVLK